MKYDYLVVGAGLSGLTASTILAQVGFRVALIEKSPSIAPVVRGFTRRGHFFDTGFHYTGGLDGNDVLDLFFRYLHVAHDLMPEPLDESGFDVFHGSDKGFIFPFPYGHDRIIEAFFDAFPEDHGAIDQYFQAVFDIYGKLPYMDLDVPLSRLSRFNDAQTISLREVLDRLTGNRLLKSLLSMHCLLHGASPEEVSFFCHACVVAPYYKSAQRIKGGGRQIIRAFNSRLDTLGVNVFTGRGAEELCFTAAGTVCGVRLDDGEVIDGTNCVVTAHPRQLLRMVPGSLFRPVYRRRLESFEETPSAYILYGLTDMTVSPFSRQNHFLFATEDFPVFDGKTPIEERPVYVAQAAAGKEEGASFMALCPALLSEVADWSRTKTGRRPEGYKAHKAQVAGRLQDRLNAVFTDLGEHTTFTESATPLTLRDYTENPLGSLYGVKHRFDQHDLLPVTRVDHLLLAGQAVAAPGLLGAMISAFLACGSVLGHDHLREELKRCR